MSYNKSRISWKQCALLLILLSHAVFGSPVVPQSGSQYAPASPYSQTFALDQNSLHTSLEDDLFGPSLEERGNRKKRLLYETLKKAKQAKLLTLGAASANAAKSVGKSILKTVATLGIKAIIFNFLYSSTLKLKGLTAGLAAAHIPALTHTSDDQYEPSIAGDLPPGISEGIPEEPPLQFPREVVSGSIGPESYGPYSTRYLYLHQ